MAYLGNTPALNYISFAKQTFTIVNGQTSYTLDNSVANGLEILLYINNVKQVEGSGEAYTASGNTLTIASALTSGSDEMYCLFIGKAVQTVNPPNASVGTSQLVDNSVTYAKASGFGKVLQVVTATETTQRTTTSNSFVTASNTLTVNITPSSTSNKILLLGSFAMHMNTSSHLATFTVYRDSTNLGHSTYGFGYTYSTGGNPANTNALTFLDSPSSSSALTYQVYIKASGGTAFISTNGATSTLTALEIGA